MNRTHVQTPFFVEAVRVPAESTPGSRKRIPGLDGLRALSILLVMLGHAAGTHNAPQALFRFERLAPLGVRVFFIISGYLITTLLLAEKTRTDTVSLRDFYLRRAYRILPCAYAYMLITFVSSASALRFVDMVTASTFTINYHISRPWLLAHLWSLSVEEQFYLLWPAALVLFFGARARILVGVIIAAPLVNCFLYYLGWRSAVGNWFPSVADALATGCLVAVLAPRLTRIPILRSRWMLAAGALAVVIDELPVEGKLPALLFTLFGSPAIHLGIAAFMYSAIHAKYRWLDLPPVVFLGTLSYSLYLWQQPFLNRYSSQWFSSFPQNLFCALAMACVSYYGLERPFLRLRERRRPNVIAVK